MTFDWQAFLEQHHIEYQAAGANEIRSRCPFCDRDDRMAINLVGKGWHCWKVREHRGVSPVRLIAALIRCSYAEAARIAGVRYQFEDLSQIEQLLRQADARQNQATSTLKSFEKISPPRFSRRISGHLLEEPFVSYLTKRGFDPERIPLFGKLYGLRYAFGGPQRYRIIFPVVCDGLLRAWTGRTIAGDYLRYLASSEEDGAEPISHFLLFMDKLKGGNRIILCEGPFDALKVWELGEHATCFFTARPSEMQVEALRDVLPRYRQRLLLLDRAATDTTMEVVRQLAALHVNAAYLPPGVKDPGELTSLAFLK